MVLSAGCVVGWCWILSSPLSHRGIRAILCWSTHPEMETLEMSEVPEVLEMSEVLERLGVTPNIPSVDPTTRDARVQ